MDMVAELVWTVKLDNVLHTFIKMITSATIGLDRKIDCGSGRCFAACR
jgi:hypothetical protein